MQYKQNLHTHTLYADGKNTLEALVLAAIEKGFEALGFGAVITSDCHNKDFLDCAFEDATALLAEAGFQTKWILTEDGFREVPL